MCGIIGITYGAGSAGADSGDTEVLDVLLEGLSRLEYRGYDSAGVALVGAAGEQGIWRARAANGTRSLDDLVKRAEAAPGGPSAGIGHTRWATHGGPTEGNAHPHVDCTGRMALIHNGIIENHVELTDELTAAGHRFESETDTEVLAHLIESSLAAHPDAGLVGAVRDALGRVRGAFSVAVVHSDEPDLIVASRRVSPLLMGVSEGAAFLASDVPAILGLTRQFFVLEDDQVAELRPGSVRVTTLEGVEVEPDRLTVDWDLDSARKDGFDDYMSKEIREQPKAVADTMLDRLLPDGTLVLDEVHITNEEFRAFNKVFIVACGSSYHAGLMAKYAIEHWARLPVEIDIASEFRYRDPVLDARTLVIGVSQSGETADTFEAIEEARRLGAKTLVISNVVDSSMARKADAVLYTRAGPEIGVAATKTHLAQITALEILALYLGQARGTLLPEDARALFDGHGRPPRQGGPGHRAGPRGRGRGHPLPGLAVLHLPRAPRRLPGGPRGGAQAQGALVPPGRGVPGRRAQARPHRPGRAGDGGHRRGHPDPGVGEDDEQRGRGQEPRGHGRAGGQRWGTRRPPARPTPCCGCPRPRTCSPRSSTWCPCRCLPTRWPGSTATTSTDPATWPRWSPSSEPAQTGPRRCPPCSEGPLGN